MLDPHCCLHLMNETRKKGVFQQQMDSSREVRIIFKSKCYGTSQRGRSATTTTIIIIIIIIIASFFFFSTPVIAIIHSICPPLPC